MKKRLNLLKRSRCDRGEEWAEEVGFEPTVLFAHALSRRAH